MANDPGIDYTGGSSGDANYTTPAAPAGPATGAQPGPYAPTGFSLPVDLYETIVQASQRYGIPPGYLAGSIYFNRDGGFGSGKNQVSDAEIARFASSLATTINLSTSWQDALTSLFGPGRASLVEQIVPGGVLDPRSVTAPSRYAAGAGGGAAPTTGFNSPATIDDVYSLFQTYFGDVPSSEQEAQQFLPSTYGALQISLINDPRAQYWRQYGTEITKAKTWVTNAYEQYVGRTPTNEEIKNALDRGYNQTTLEQYLSSRPIDPADPSKGTLGQRSAVQESATKYAAQYLGRPADPGEVNFMAQNGISTPDQVQAFYEQMQQRQQTGDPAFTWVGNPQQWRDMQTNFQNAWRSAGMTGVVDPHLVNQAVSGNWSQDQIANYIDAQPAPGFDPSVTVGQVNRIRPIADKWKETWYPDQKTTNAEMQHFITNKMDSNQIHDYYGNMPSTTQSAPPAPKVDLTNPQHAPRQNAQTGVTQ